MTDPASAEAKASVDGTAPPSTLRQPTQLPSVRLRRVIGVGVASFTAMFVLALALWTAFVRTAPPTESLTRNLDYYDICGLLTIAGVYGAIMAAQQALFATRASRWVVWWPLAPWLGYLIVVGPGALREGHEEILVFAFLVSAVLLGAAALLLVWINTLLLRAQLRRV